MRTYSISDCFCREIGKGRTVVAVVEQYAFPSLKNVHSWFEPLLDALKSYP